MVSKVPHRIRVGIVGLSADPKKYEIVAVSMSSAENAAASAKFHGLLEEKGYCSVDALARDPEVDLVVVSVKVPRRFELTMQAIDVGKDVYVEWPIASNLEQAEALAQRAREKGVKSLVGLPTRFAPQVHKMKEILESGVLGRVLATNLLVTDDLFLKFHADKRHSHDQSNGANIVTIAGGHLIDAMTSLLGELKCINAQTSMLFPKPTLHDEKGNEKRGERNDSPDCFVLHGRLGDGQIPASVCMYSHPATTPNLFQWIITGDKGSLKMEGPSLMIHMIPPKLFQTETSDKVSEWAEIHLSQTTASGAEYHAWAENDQAKYHAWAENDQAKIVTLDDALVRYRMIDAIFRSAESGAPTSYSSVL